MFLGFIESENTYLQDEILQGLTRLIVIFSKQFKDTKNEDIHLFFLKLLLNDILIESITEETNFSAFFKFIENMLRIPSDKELLTKEINFEKIL